MPTAQRGADTDFRADRDRPGKRPREREEPRDRPPDRDHDRDRNPDRKRVRDGERDGPRGWERERHRGRDGRDEGRAREEGRARGAREEPRTRDARDDPRTRDSRPRPTARDLRAEGEPDRARERDRVRPSGREHDRDRDRDRPRDRDRDRDSHREQPRERENDHAHGRGDRDRGRCRVSDTVNGHDNDDQRLQPGKAAASGHTHRQDASALDAPHGPSSKQPDAGTPEMMEEGEHGAAPNTDKADGNGTQANRAGPVSLEEMLRKKKEAEAEAAKPKFMSKKEREALALERRKQEQAGMQQAAQARRAAARQQQPNQEERRSGARDDPGAGHSKSSYKDREKELEFIRQQYLGTTRQKRRIAKASDKFRFNFDWDAKEDTYQERLHEGVLLFGRGTLAGLDHRAQREEAAKREQKVLHELRIARGEMTTAADVDKDIARITRASQIDEVPLLNQKHWTEKERDNMSSRDWRIFREDHRISYKNAGQNAPMPFRNWDEMPLPLDLRRAVEDQGYAKPTPIQMASMPFGLRQRDVIGLAETGSGKTAAFVLPMLVYIMGQPKMTEQVAADGPYALILAPTRELAQQIEEETIQLAKYTGFRTACIVGGASYEEQTGKLRRGAEIVVATPGRLLDCLRRTLAVLNQCNYIVLDEADRMIDLGFEPQVIDVLAAMPSSNLKPENEELLEAERTYRTTYMFSATMPPAVERIAKRYLRRPVTVTVGSAGRATDQVTQRVEWTEKKAKPASLMRVLDTFQHATEHLSGDQDGFKVIVFVNNRENSEDVYNLLTKGEYSVALLHGGKSQEQREECIKGFRDGMFDVMIATDVAGRGIDVKDVGLVINYDMPHTIENYTHRIGRTGRAGRRGTAVTFLTASDEKTFYDLKCLLEESKASIPPQLANHEATKIKPGGFESKKDTTLFAQ